VTKDVLALVDFLEQAASNSYQKQPVDAPSGQNSEAVTPLTHRDAEWYGSTIWTGPDWTRVGRNWHHPGQNNPSVHHFTAPVHGAPPAAAAST
jgi:hypothetical protein